MLSDKHFKVLHYEADASKLFTNTDIKGGVAVSYRDTSKDFGAIGVFTPQEELQGILKKSDTSKGSISDIGISGYAYHFTEQMHLENPTIRRLQSKGHDYDLKSNVIEKLSQIFLDKDPDNGESYIRIMGRQKNERVIKFIKRTYINSVSNLDKYKLFLPKASGTGAFGEALAPAEIGEPGVGSTETFFSLGAFSNQTEAEYLNKYLKTKFARTLLSVAKKTQMITPSTFKHVPLQDFTSASDIDWSQSVAGIDRQLYKKYGLSEDEISFIETHVKEME